MKYLEQGDIEIGIMQQEILECTKNLTVIKIMSISYLLLKQFVTLIRTFMKHNLRKATK